MRLTYAGGRFATVRIRFPKDRRAGAGNWQERGHDPETLEKAKGDPAHPRRVPSPDYRPPYTVGDELSLAPPIQPRAAYHQEQGQEQLAD